MQRFRPSRVLLDATCPIEWAHPLNRAVVAEWSAQTPLPGWSAGTQLKDLVRGAKSASDGTLNGSAKYKGDRINCPTTSDIIQINGTTQINFGATGKPFAVTLAMRGRSGHYKLAHTAIGASGARPFYFTDESTIPNFWVYDGTNNVQCSGTSTIMQDGKLHIYTGVRDTAAALLRIYVDGRQEGTVSDTAGNCSNASSVIQFNDIGSLGLGGDEDFISLVMHNRLLLAPEVTALHQQIRRGNPDRWRWVSRRTWFLPSGAFPGDETEDGLHWFPVARW